MTSHVISPFTVYQYYILKAFTNSSLDFHTLWHDQKPTSPLNDNDRLKEFIEDSSNADFIRANVPVINVYMPLTAPAFMYMSFEWMFHTDNEQLKETFTPLFALSIAQVVLSIFFFHVSFYSASSPCWDRVGFWVHQLVLIVNHIVIPCIVTIMVIMTFADSDTEGNTPFSTLNLSYAIISIFATLKIIW